MQEEEESLFVLSLLLIMITTIYNFKTIDM